MSGDRHKRMNELVDLVPRKIATAIIVAAGLVALSIYARPGPPRFQVVSEGETIIRIETKHGSIVACRDGKCMKILQPMQRLDRFSGAS